jgi:hypothetical protein
MFSYNSVQEHFVMGPQGKEEKIKRVIIKNGKGVKEVITRRNGKAVKNKKQLTKKEIKNIKEHNFMPNLFTSLLRTNQNSRKTRKRR